MFCCNNVNDYFSVTLNRKLNLLIRGYKIVNKISGNINVGVIFRLSVNHACGQVVSKYRQGEMVELKVYQSCCCRAYVFDVCFHCPIIVLKLGVFKNQFF